MTRRLDLTIGQRLALGFGAAGVLLALLVGLSHFWTDRVAEERKRQLSVIGPRTVAADRLENAVLYVGVAIRNYILIPEPSRLQAYQRSAQELRDSLDVLARLPKEPDGQILFAPIPELVARYLQATAAMAEAARRDADVRALEPPMSAAREVLASRVRDYSSLQQAKLEETRAAISRSVERMDRSTLTIGIAALVLLAITGWFTASAVRRPARTLTAAARRLADGDHEPAVRLADGVPGERRPRDELAELSLAFGRMALELKTREERLQAQFQEIQAQQEELQAQHEEIQAQNEELHSQNEELQAQGDELQTQGEELRSTVERLVASEEALRAADANKNQFLAMLSHELRNPLAPIRNSLYILERADPGSEQARQARVVLERQVAQMVRLVEDLLDVTRISRGKVRLQKTAVDLAELVRQAAEDNATEFSSRGIDLAVDVAGRAVVDGDPARLSQVIGNLLQNAAKFTRPGGRVQMALEPADGRARIRVRDNGAGIDPETLSRLFQPFIQAESSLHRANGGLGLGLALVKGLVELHGGWVTASSDGLGKGAEFVVELPTAAVAEAPPPRAAAPATGACRRVLVIEDNVDAADTLRDVLLLGGHQVEVAHRGSDGVDKARRWRPDVILCDIGLPDMDGHEVARTFRSDPALRSCFLVALTGYALPEDLQRASEAGFDEHLAKPPRLDRLEQLLAHLPPVSSAG